MAQANNIYMVKSELLTQCGSIPYRVFVHLAQGSIPYRVFVHLAQSHGTQCERKSTDSSQPNKATRVPLTQFKGSLGPGSKGLLSQNRQYLHSFR